MAEMTPGVGRYNDVKEIASAAQRAGQLTRQLLAFSRSQVLSPKIIAVNEIVKGMDGMLRRLIGADIAFRLELANDIGNVKADPGQLEQVVMNLVVNARDAMPSGGRLTVQTSLVDVTEDVAEQRMQLSAGRYAVIAVSDTGTGMTPEIQARIFEPFFTTKEEGRGTGLGLATVFGIVQQSGGAVWVYSEVGEGTTFKVYLPWIAEHSEAAHAAGAPVIAIGGTENVVDDDAHIRAIAERALRDAGYRVTVFADGGAAADAIPSTAAAPALLITDVVMPRLRGPDLAARMRAAWPDVCVLYMTGYTDRVIEPGASPHVLQKPFTPSELLKTVRQVLDRVPAV
jgi:CheY-like chemotaxis protein